MKDKVIVLVGIGQQKTSTIKKAIGAIAEEADIEVVVDKNDIIERARDEKDIISLSLVDQHLIENSNNIYLSLTNSRELVNDKYMHPTQKQLESLIKHNNRRKK